MDELATYIDPSQVQYLVVRLDEESVAAIRGEAPLPDTPVVLDQRGLAMTKAPDGTWHYVVRLADGELRE